MLPPKHTYDMFNHIQKYCKQFVIQDPFTSAETKNSNKKKKKKNEKLIYSLWDSLPMNNSEL